MTILTAPMSSERLRISVGSQIAWAFASGLAQTEMSAYFSRNNQHEEFSILQVLQGPYITGWGSSIAAGKGGGMHTEVVEEPI